MVGNMDSSECQKQVKLVTDKACYLGFFQESRTDEGMILAKCFSTIKEALITYDLLSF